MSTIGRSSLPSASSSAASVAPATSLQSARAGEVAELAPTARPAVDDGRYAAPAPSARNAFQRDVLAFLPPVRQPVQSSATPHHVERQTAEAGGDPVELRSADVPEVNGEGGVLSRFSSALQRVLMRDNASDAQPRMLAEQTAALPESQSPAHTVPAQSGAFAALMAHLPLLPRGSRVTRHAAAEGDPSEAEAEAAEAAEARRQESLGRTRLSRRV